MEKTKHISLVFTAVVVLGAVGCSGDTEPTNDNPSGGMGGGSSAEQGGSGGGGGGFTQRGVCGQRGESPVTATTFGDGFEEWYILGNRGFDPEICIVRFPVKRLGDAPAGCTDCLWSHMIGYEMPTVVLDMDGVCEASELGMNSARINEIVASTAAYGFVSEFSGHNSVLMKYDESLQAWDAYGNATWDPETNAFSFDRRDGQCLY